MSRPTKASAGAWIASFGCVIVLAECGDAVGTPIRGGSVIVINGSVETDGIGPSPLADSELLMDAEPPNDAVESVEAAQFDAAQPETAPTDVAQPDSNGITESADCSTVADWPSEWTNAEQALLEGIFKLRNVPAFICEGSGIVDWAWIGLPQLRYSPELRCSARLHSVDMSQRGFFSQTNPDGITPPERMWAAGFDTVWLWAEWIHQGSDPDEALESLMKGDSWGCEYFTDSRLTAIGIGYYEGYWTLDVAFVAR
ncbi:MAG: hypothetical protein JXA30_20115 [Deltaproteobacteria bacterium]|nr:hypothetical protein [Deltaproteobacteria bacterium]